MIWWERVAAYNHPVIYHVELIYVHGVYDEGAAEQLWAESVGLTNAT